MTAKEDILKAISAGHDNSRKISRETDYAQEYVRRVVNQLAADGLVEIVKEPRGFTYRIEEGVISGNRD
jgi:DNA-binding IscR family transcriptional regulator